jgi:hypothetical protein
LLGKLVDGDFWRCAMRAGWYKRRRGILEHLENGEIGLIDLAIHDFLLLKANLVDDPASALPAGVCITSARAIYETCIRDKTRNGFTERTVRRSLEHLERIGWIKRFREQGKHGNYPIVIERASVHDLSVKEFRVSAAETIDWRQPKLIPAVTCPRPVRDVSTLREVEKKREREKKTPAPKVTAPADPRFQPFFSFAYESYKAKHQRKPIWQGKERSGLKNLLRNQSAADLPLERLNTLYQNFISSTESFTVKQKDSLAYFCSNIDKFSDGPIVERGKENGNRKQTTIEKALSTAAATREWERKNGFTN